MVRVGCLIGVAIDLLEALEPVRRRTKSLGGGHSVVERMLDDLSHLEWAHLSFDLNVVDPGIAPGAGTHDKSGLTYREAT